MHIITRQRLREFAEKYPEAESALDHWYRIIKRTEFNSLVELRQAFPHADLVGTLIVFNIGGNKVRLITAIHFNSKRVFIRDVLTHAEYDQNRWRK